MVNMDGFVVDDSTLFWDIFLDHIGPRIVHYSEILAIILAFEFATNHGWLNVCVESDSTTALTIFYNPEMVL
jgi:hypothetical protein